MNRHTARAALGALALALSLGGCSNLWPWSSKTALPELAALTLNRAQLAWSTPLRGGGAGFQPVVAAGSVFAAGRDGSVLRLDAGTGAVIWRATSEKGVSTGVGSDGSLSVVVDSDGVLHAIDAEGRRKWSTPTGAAVTTVPAIGSELIVARTSDNRVLALDAKTGQRRWVFSRQNPPLVLQQSASIAMDAGLGYVGLPGGRLLALDLGGGALRWEGAVAAPRGSNEIERIADVLGTPKLVANEVCAATFLGKVACFEASSGRALWSRDIPAVGGLDRDAQMLVVADDRGHVHALSGGGTALWREEQLAGRSLSAPLLLSEVVVVGDAKGLVHLLARADGKLVGRITTDGSAIVSQPVRAGELAVVQTSAGGLFAIAVRQP